MTSYGAGLEWLFFLFAVLAVLMSVYIWHLAVQDRRRARDENWSAAAQFVATGNVHGETINVSIASLCLFGGVTSVSIPPPPGDFAIAAIWELSGLICISALVVAQGLRALYYRRRILGLASIRQGPKHELPIEDFGKTKGVSQ